MAKYFTIEELTASTTAKALHIDNTPKEPNIIAHLNMLMEFLDEIRSYINSPIIISSGYRCPELNKKVGGSANSAHTTGYAADIQPSKGMTFEHFRYKVLESIEDKDFDQCIIEKDSKGARWLHISIDPKNRKQVFKMNK